MKKFILTLAIILFANPVLAQEHADHTKAVTLMPVKAEYVCMVTDRAFDTPQIPTVVNGKTYYGCCPMCKTRLEGDASVRTAIDPATGKEVDKGSAFIGAMPDGTVHYFANMTTMNAFLGRINKHSRESKKTEPMPMEDHHDHQH